MRSFFVVALVFGLVGWSDTDAMDIAVEFEQETGQTFDHVTYTNNPIENWPSDMQSYVELLATGMALLQQRRIVWHFYLLKWINN